jgi:hypothetical protein
VVGGCCRAREGHSLQPSRWTSWRVWIRPVLSGLATTCPQRCLGQWAAAGRGQLRMARARPQARPRARVSAPPPHSLRRHPGWLSVVVQLAELEVEVVRLRLRVRVRVRMLGRSLGVLTVRWGPRGVLDGAFVCGASRRQ